MPPVLSGLYHEMRLLLQTAISYEEPTDQAPSGTVVRLVSDG